MPKILNLAAKTIFVIIMNLFRRKFWLKLTPLMVRNFYFYVKIYCNFLIFRLSNVSVVILLQGTHFYRNFIKFFNFRINNEVKRRPDAVKFSETCKNSGIEGFPVLTNKENHYLARVISTETVFDEKEGKIIKIVAQKLKNSITTEVSLLNISLKDIWNNSPIRVDTLLRIIEPLKISENVNFLKKIIAN